MEEQRSSHMSNFKKSLPEIEFSKLQFCTLFTPVTPLWGHQGFTISRTEISSTSFTCDLPKRKGPITWQNGLRLSASEGRVINDLTGLFFSMPEMTIEALHLKNAVKIMFNYFPCSKNVPFYDKLINIFIGWTELMMMSLLSNQQLSMTPVHWGTRFSVPSHF